jgi:hypothetical protein
VRERHRDRPPAAQVLPEVAPCQRDQTSCLRIVIGEDGGVDRYGRPRVVAKPAWSVW